MHFSKKTIRSLAEMICGKQGTISPEWGWSNFPYRGAPRLYEFFTDDCRFAPIPKFDGAARITWTVEVLTSINEGKVSHQTGLVLDHFLLHVIRKLLESVVIESNLNHEGAISDLNKVLAEEGLQIQLVDRKYRFVRISSLDSDSAIVGYVEVEKSLDDFATFVSSKERMGFWESEGRKHKWTTRPERSAQKLLHAHLDGRFRDAVYTFKEVGTGAGRIDLLIITPLWEKSSLS